VLKIPTFRCHGNEGRSRVNFSYTVKVPDLDNPLIGAKFLALCLILGELWLYFCYHGNICLSDVNFNVAVKLADLFGATSLALSLAQF